MDFPKKQQQCLIPRYLLQYLTSLQTNHDDPTAPWGGGGGGTYTAGDGIEISDEDVISIDDTVALKSDIPSLTGYATETWVTNQGYLVQSDLSDYVTSSELITELGNYVTSTDLATELLNYAELDDIPTKTSDLTNDSGFITSSALTNYVTTNTTQTISGSKTFTNTVTFSGSNGTTGNVVFTGRNPIKMTAPSGSGSSTGFTLFNSNNYEKGYLQYIERQDALYLGRWSGGTPSSSPKYAQNIGFLSESGGTGYRVLMPNKTATGSSAESANTYYIPTEITNGTTVVKASSDGIIDISSLISGGGGSYSAGTGIDITNNTIAIDSTVVALKSDIPSLTGYATESWVTNQGYSTFSGSYNDLTDKPTIPTIRGSYSGSYWTSITINGTTKSIPSGEPTNMVTTNTDQNITGTKTFVGKQKIRFKQQASSETLGFTAYSNNSYELGNLQIANRNVGGSTYPYVTLGNFSTQKEKAKVGFRIQPNSSQYSYNFVMPYGTYSNFESNTYSTSSDTTIPCAFTDGTTKIKADATGLVDLGALNLGTSVSGTNDGTNWTSLTIGSDTYGLASGSTPANMVTTDTDQDIDGVKTFLDRSVYLTERNTISGTSATNISFYEKDQPVDRWMGSISANHNYLRFNGDSDKTKIYYMGLEDPGYSQPTYVGFYVAGGTLNNKLFAAPHPSYSTGWASAYPDQVYYIPMVISDGTTNYYANEQGIVTIPSGGSSYTAGTGIDITNDVISVDSTVVALKSDIPTVPTKTSELTNDSNFVTTSDLATVATTGSYNDLSNKPTIPDAVSGTNDGTNWTSLTIGSDTYGIPSGGSGSGPTVTRYTGYASHPITYAVPSNQSQYSYIYIGIYSSELSGFLNYDNVNPGDILYIDTTMSYTLSNNQYYRYSHLFTVSVPPKPDSTYPVYAISSSDLFDGNVSGSWACDTVNRITNTQQTTASNIVRRTANGLDTTNNFYIRVPLQGHSNQTIKVTINSITHIAF